MSDLDLGLTPIHGHTMMVVGSSFEAVEFAELEGVNSEVMEFILANFRFGLVSGVAISSGAVKDRKRRCPPEGVSLIYIANRFKF